MPQLTKPYTNWFDPSLNTDQSMLVTNSAPDLFANQPTGNAEFSFDSMTAPLTKAGANVSRLIASSADLSDQGQSPKWYDITGRISSAASSVNSAFQSTLIKIIIILALVGFGFIYFQAKVVNLANK